MAKSQTFFCSACGAEAPKWAGQCAACGDWNTLTAAPSAGRSGNRTAGTARGGGYAGITELTRLDAVRATAVARTVTGLDELDRVLGGGLVAGSVNLLGGDPGIGKSTLLLQLLMAVHGTQPALYVTGEESLSQVSMRADRLGAAGSCDLPLLADTQVETILAQAEATGPRIIVVDSIQTMWTADLDSAPGSVSQVRESAARLVRYAKQSGTTVFLVGHVTKEGAIAGPRVLEHMVDAVLYFESDQGSRFRLVRAVKNRFGTINELGIFAMTETGLKPVANPSAIFLSREGPAVPGSTVLITREGTRPLLVECQALVDASHLSNPRRVAVGLDGQRLAMLLAVAHRHCGIAMADQDVFVNIVGGVRITETAADLAVLLAALSSFRDRPIPADWVVFGEVGLSGEVRPVPGGEDRIREAAKHGFKRAIVPVGNRPRKGVEGIEVLAVARVAEALDGLS